MITGVEEGIKTLGAWALVAALSAMKFFAHDIARWSQRWMFNAHIPEEATPSFWETTSRREQLLCGILATFFFVVMMVVGGLFTMTAVDDAQTTGDLSLPICINGLFFLALAAMFLRIAILGLFAHLQLWKTMGWQSIPALMGVLLAITVGFVSWMG